MIRIHLRSYEVNPWRSFGGTHLRGIIFGDDESLRPSDLPLGIDPCSAESEIADFLSRLNGMFAMIRVGDAAVVAAVDRVRSTPLFYSTKGGVLFISDDAHWIAGQVGSSSIHAGAVIDFATVGYVTGARTIHADIYQLRAGELLLASRVRSSWVIRTIRYYRYLHSAEHDHSTGDLLEVLDSVLLTIFGRLTDHAAGRMIVVPLSGGLDSRLIVQMLKRLNYANVICFTYGSKLSWEVRVSRQVAGQLNYPWIFIDYSGSKWVEWFFSDECRSYRRFGSGLSSLAHIQDWPAVMEMKRTEIIPCDSLFVPGHSADFVAGSHLSSALVAGAVTTTEDVAKAIISHHYNLCDLDCESDSVRSHIACSVRSAIQDLEIANSEQACSAFECWNWEERQAKFICNSLRVYEFFGYDWAMPFWDADFMDFWLHVPADLRSGCRLYRRYLAECKSIPCLSVNGFSLGDRITAKVLRFAGYDAVNAMQFARRLPIPRALCRCPLTTNAYLAAYELDEIVGELS